MVTIKSYTDLEQSKVLAKILPLENADMFYSAGNETQPEFRLHSYGHIMSDEDIPCWSLAALLDVLSDYTLKSSRFYGKVALWCQGISVEYDNPIDACVGMILKLHELNLL